MLLNSSLMMSLKPLLSPAALSLKLRCIRRVIFSTAILLANSPDLAPPIPSLTAKTKSEVSMDASPIFPR